MSKFFRRLIAILFFCACFWLQPALAQDTTLADSVTARVLWDHGGTGTINFSQVSLSNWAAGGQNSLSVLGIANLYANYKDGPNTWNNNLDVTFGTVKIENQRLRKSDDRIELNLKYGRRASEQWFYTAQLNARTQLTPTYNDTRTNRLSNFFSPAFITSSLGMDYKPNEKLSVFLSPLTSKFTIVASQGLADTGAFGVQPAMPDILGNPVPGTGRHFRGEFGGFVNVRFRQEIMKNITLQSKIDLFSNYVVRPQNIDVNFENLLNFKVNKFVSASIFVHMIYDDDIPVKVDRTGDGVLDGTGPRLQLKETLGIGLSYKFK
ncbi:DUF3078 domain-containing protein [Pontibacter sp. SGAir0037]|uniref:DUF3078 domain-containing protein n=1 Tax=Pontibacter sp. SGAir0037 TaxID=2571030 RepID=UPI0010CD5336|nr:DUF3078 domain-containing protein [Pontibacter sp. SGAir0037]QCR24420.1 hypothetical protein C1N53_20045 [Pontibacter sp. SGAir0037]